MATSVARLTIQRGVEVLVSGEDFAWASQYPWRQNREGYVRARRDGREVWLHRLVACAAPGQITDHINGDLLDNRRENLRLCSKAENVRNSRRVRGASRFKGVSWHAHSARWKAQITVNYRRIVLGRFQSEEAAARAYDAAAIQHFGAFAVLNFRDLYPAEVAL